MSDKVTIIPVDDAREAPVDVSTATPAQQMLYRYEPIAPPYHPEVTMSEPTPTPVSPTGTPLLPPAAVPYVIAGGGLLAIVAEELSNPGPWDAARILKFVAKSLVPFIIGAISPGLRR